MARTLTTKDAYAIINLMVKEATGQDATIQAVDPSTFVSVGEKLLASGVENTLNALSLVLGRTLVAVRPYKAKFELVNALNSGLYANRLRKISFYAREAMPTGASNTDLFTNDAPAYDNGTNSGASTPSMWIQNPPIPLELNFGGSSEWQTSTTVYEKQLQVAFRSPEDFIRFVDGIMVEKANDIESMKEAFNRMAVLNAIAGCYDLSSSMGGSVINMTKAFNDYYITSYTSDQLLSTYLTEFTEFFISTIKRVSNYMTNRSKKYHWSPSKTINGITYDILRHTPKDRQKMFMISDLWIKTEALVKPQVFNDDFISFGNFEAVDFWQNEMEPYKISITPAIPDVAGTNSGAQTAGTAVALDKVLGFMFDEDSVMLDYQFEDASTTVKEARKHFRNVWWTIRRNAMVDYTENMVLFYMADPVGGGGSKGDDEKKEEVPDEKKEGEE